MAWVGRPVSRRRYLQIAGGLTGLTVLTAAGAAEADSDNELVVTVNGGVSGEFAQNVVFPEFEKRTGGKIIAVAGLTMQNLAKLRASKGRPSLDVIGMDPPGTVPAASEGLLEKLDPNKIPNMRDLFSWAVPASGDYVAVNSDYQMLAYNTKNITSGPDSWEVLWKPEFKNKIILPDITTSHGIFFIAIISKMQTGDFFNTDAAFEKLASLKPNVLTYWTSHDQVVQLLTSGQAWFAPWTSDRAVYQVGIGAPIDLVVPAKDGALFTPSDYCVAKGTTHLALAEAYVNIWLDPKIQAMNAEKIYNGPSNKLAPLTGLAKKYYSVAELKLLNIDWSKLLQVQSGWVDRWNRDMVR
jgi:putative spermidine/putrescine transport system substrate-binding protein